MITEALEDQGMRVFWDAPMPGQPSEHPDLLRRRTPRSAAGPAEGTLNGQAQQRRPPR